MYEVVRREGHIKRPGTRVGSGRGKEGIHSGVHTWPCESCHSLCPGSQPCHCVISLEIKRTTRISLEF